MHVKLLFPNEYLCAADLQRKDAALTIREVKLEMLRTQEGDERKPIVYFVETRAKAQKTGAKEKKLVLNKTNAMMIAELHGTEVDNWKGRRITLYPTTTQAFGATVECIRVRPEKPAELAGKSEPPAEDQDAFPKGSAQFDVAPEGVNLETGEVLFDNERPPEDPA